MKESGDVLFMGLLFEIIRKMRKIRVDLVIVLYKCDY